MLMYVVPVSEAGRKLFTRKKGFLLFWGHYLCRRGEKRLVGIADQRAAKEHFGGEGFVIKLATRVANDFMGDLRWFTSFDWRAAAGAIEMAVHPSYKGWWVGKNGHRIRALEAHLGVKINLVDGKMIASQTFNADGRRISGCNMMAAEQLKKAAFVLFDKVGEWVNELTHGYVAPWKIPA